MKQFLIINICSSVLKFTLIVSISNGIHQGDFVLLVQAVSNAQVVYIKLTSSEKETMTTV